MRVTILHNPTAGNGSVTKKDLLAACKLAGMKATYYSTKADDITKALRKPADLVVAAGGDGTVAKIACAMLHRKVPFAIVPLGNANNVARSLGIAGTVQELAESWAQGHTQPLDIGVASGTWGNRKFVEAVGVGPLAEVIGHNSVSDRKHGADNLRQGRKELRRAFKKTEARKYQLALDGKPVGGKHIAIEIANLPFTGPGLELSPKIAAGDGRLSAVYVRAKDRGKVLDWLKAPHEARAPLRAKRGQRITFRWHGSPLRVDDQALPPPKQTESVNIELAGTIDVIVPEKINGNGDHSTAKSNKTKKRGNGKGSGRQKKR
jgi:diacylglycerol kinase family enzyme